MEKTRYLKTVTFNSVNDVEKIEKTVNITADKLIQAGAKIVSIIPTQFGLSPMNLIYNIIYEHDHALTGMELSGKGK